MAWLQKRPQVALPATYQTRGMHTVRIIVGLGNPEPKYDLTRHNVGFYCLDGFVSRFSEMAPWVKKADLNCLMSTGRMGDSQIIAVKPLTYMNHSGQSVQAVMHYYKASLEQLVVVHDELDMPFGTIRSRIGGSAAGHNGIKSISEAVGEEYGRLRIGIGPKDPPQIDSADFVLQRFNEAELAQLENLAQETTALLSEYIFAKQLPQDTRSFIV